MKQRIALFRSVAYDYIAPVTQRKDCLTDEPDENYSPSSDYLRLTEWREVEFDSLPDDVLVPQQLAALAKEREAVVEKFHKVLAGIDGRIANLRAVTYQAVQS